MKVSQRLLAESFVDQFARFLRGAYAMSMPDEAFEPGNFHMLEYVSRSHDTPFPLIYVIETSATGIIAISVTELPRSRQIEIIEYLAKLEEFSEDDRKTMGAYIRKYKLENIVRQVRIIKSNVAPILSSYWLMIDEIMQSEQFQEL